jgi:hypothetical protein
MDFCSLDAEQDLKWMKFSSVSTSHFSTNRSSEGMDTDINKIK